MTKANVDSEEDGGDDDANRSENTHDDIDDDIDGQQLADSPVSGRSATCRYIEQQPSRRHSKQLTPPTYMPLRWAGTLCNQSPRPSL